MKLVTLFLLLCVCLLTISAQSPTNALPEYGAIADLKGLTKMYLSTDSTQARKYILDELKKDKTLEVVSSPDDAQFILECKQTGRIVVGGLVQEMETFEMTAYTMKGERRRVAWSATKNSIRYPPTMLTRDFIKALKKAAK